MGEMKYLGFIEAIEPDLVLQSSDGPDDALLAEGWLLWRPSTRLRFSGVSLLDFEELMENVSPLEQGVATPTERARRLAELRDHLHAERLPLVDVLLPLWLDLTERVLGMARLGGWYLLTVQERKDELHMAPAFFAYPEAEEPVARRFFLKAFEEAPADLAVRLRDIFSLVHVEDWNPEGGPEGDGTVSPIDPDGGQGLVIFRAGRRKVDDAVPEEERAIADPYAQAVDDGMERATVSS